MFLNYFFKNYDTLTLKNAIHLFYTKDYQRQKFKITQIQSTRDSYGCYEVCIFTDIILAYAFAHLS